MSQKRKVEEYHDPDYSQFHSKHSNQISDSGNDNTQPSSSRSISDSPKTNHSEDRGAAIQRIIETEFQRELQAKESELEEIEKRLSEAKQLLAKVRYTVIYNYYTKKSQLCNIEDSKTVDNLPPEARSSSSNTTETIQANETGKSQLAIHPSLKKLLGKRPIDYNEILKVRPTRKAAQNATEQFHKLKKPTSTEARVKVKEEPALDIDDSTSDGEDIKKPRYVAPSTINTNRSVEQLNSARGRNNYRHLIVVGNTSKYIGDDEAELGTNVSHKWLLYISTKTAAPVEHIVSRARFFLHESYKPNDIIEVSAPPFQLSKRGWGEFSVRVQLYFHPHLMQKPIQIFHTLVLDKKHTGLQTMGSETIVELWLNVPNNTDEETASNSHDNSINSSNSTTYSKLPDDPSNQADEDFNTTNLIQLSTIKQEKNDENNEPMPSTLQASENVNNIVIKQEPVAESMEIAPSNNVCDEFMKSECNTNSTNNHWPTIPKPAPLVAALPKVIPIVSSNLGKRFIKCVDKKTGKVSLIEMVQDAKNPKIFKMVLPNTQKHLSPLNVQKAAVVTQSTGNVNTPKLIPIPKQMLFQNKLGNLANLTPPKVLPSVSSCNDANILKSSAPATNKNLAPSIAQQPILRTVMPIVKGNNKVFVLDSNKISKSNTKPQQSLLKPQVSLLKSAAVNNTKSMSNRSTLLLSQPKTMHNNIKVITVSNISGLQNKNITVFVPNEQQNVNVPSGIGNVEGNLPAPINHQHGIELERRFLSQNALSNMTDGISWLLKAIPLISARVIDAGFKEEFPFVVHTVEDFERLPVMKQRCFEWLRAKYIRRLVAKHQALSSAMPWTTKEIVLYARWFGYTPHFASTHSKATKSAGFDQQDVKDIVKTELIREHLENDGISFNIGLVNWMNNVERSVQIQKKKDSDDAFVAIDVVDDSDSNETNALRMDQSMHGARKPYLPIDAKYQDGISLVNDVSRSMQIKFEPEELIEGVMHRSAEQVLVVAMRAFIEDLLRKSSGQKQRSFNQDCSSLEISTEDIQRTLSTIKHFDFLTNKNFGVDKTVDSL